MASRKALEAAHALQRLSPEEAAEIIDQHYPPAPDDSMREGFKMRVVRYEFSIETLELRRIVDYGKGNGVDMFVVDFPDCDTAVRVLKAALEKVVPAGASVFVAVPE